jgi:hypothetical protein
VNNQKAFSFSPEAFAGARMTHRYQKEAQPQGQHNGVCFRDVVIARPEKENAMDQNNEPLIAARCGAPQRYRKVIRIRVSARAFAS